ncbi:MAG: hypothetical protein DMF76_10750 [Acidobacteria bacterium]|nr:MAG: hypothetical protein DMF76_10750 [Acidobacteriota bacterium]
MCLRFCSVLSILAVIFIQTSVAKPDDSVDVQELKRLEKVWNDAYVRADADALEQLCADDLVVTMTDMVVLNKRSSIAILRSGKVKFERYETSDLGIHVYDRAAVVTGRLQRTRSVQGREVNDEWRFTKVYIRRGGKWLVVAWHASTVAIKQ